MVDRSFSAAHFGSRFDITVYVHKQRPHTYSLLLVDIPFSHCIWSYSVSYYILFDSSPFTMKFEIIIPDCVTSFLRRYSRPILTILAALLPIVSGIFYLCNYETVKVNLIVLDVEASLGEKNKMHRWSTKHWQAMTLIFSLTA